MVTSKLVMICVVSTFLVSTLAEQGTNIELGDPDSGEFMSVDVKVVDPVAGEPPKLRLLKEGETTEFCLTFESIFEATSYDTISGTYTEVTDSQIDLNSESNDCTLTAQDSNTADIECSVGGTLTFTIDSQVQIDSSGIETGAKYTMILADYTWKSSAAKLVMVHSFETCVTDSRRRLETGAIILEDDSSEDPQEVDYGPSAFDIHGKALDVCATYSSIVERSLVKQSDKIHIVFEHFDCTLSMDPFFGLENEEYGVFETTEAGPIIEVGSMSMVYTAVMVAGIAFLAFIFVFINYLPEGTCSCINYDRIHEEKRLKAEQEAAKKREADIENQREEQIETDAVENKETKGNDAEVENDTKEDKENHDTNEELALAEKEVGTKTDIKATKREEDKQEVEPTQDVLAEDKVVAKAENVDTAYKKADEDKKEATEETQAVVEEPVASDEEPTPNEEEHVASEEEPTPNDEEPAPKHEAPTTNDTEPVANEEDDKVADLPSKAVAVAVTAAAPKVDNKSVSGPQAVGTPIKVTLERAWEAGAEDDSSESEEEEYGDVMGDLNSVRVAINARQILNPVPEMQTPQSTAL